MSYRIHTFFLSQEVLWRFKEKIYKNLKDFLLMMYGYHKAAFTFEVSFSTSTYDARWMCFNFTHSFIVGSVDLHNSLETFSIRIVWQLRSVKGNLVLTPHKVWKMQCIWKRDIKNNAVQNKNTISRVIVHQGPLNTYFLQYWKRFIQTKATVTEIANRFNWPQRGNEHRHDWQIPHNTPYNKYFNCVVRRFIKLFFHS